MISVWSSSRAARSAALCVTNKFFTYLLAGLAIAGFDTPGQHDLGVDLGRGAPLVPAGDVEALAAHIRSLAPRPGGPRLRQADRVGGGVARRWHWEHDAERGTLYRLVEEALS